MPLSGPHSYGQFLGEVYRAVPEATPPPVASVTWEQVTNSARAHFGDAVHVWGDHTGVYAESVTRVDGHPLTVKRYALKVIFLRVEEFTAAGGRPRSVVRLDWCPVGRG